MRAGAAEKRPLIDDELSTAHGAQIGGTEASAGAPAQEDRVKFPIVVGIKIEDRRIALTVEQAFDTVSPLLDGRLLVGDVDDAEFVHRRCT